MSRDNWIWQLRYVKAFRVFPLFLCLFHNAIEGQITEIKGAGRRRKNLLDD